MPGENVQVVEPIRCGTFSRARRYPLVLARFYGWRITVTFAVGVLIGFVLVWASRGVWGALFGTTWVPWLLGPLSCGVFVSKARLDGRPPLWTLATWILWGLGAGPRRMADLWRSRPVRVALPDRPTPSVGAPRPVPWMAV